MCKIGRVRSCIAGIAAFVFAITNVAITDFAFARTTAFKGPILQSPSKTFQVSDSQSLSNLLQRLPQEFGFLKTMTLPDARSSTEAGLPAFVIHIQDAHANPGAQTNIKNILEYLNEHVDGLTIGMEGTSGPFHPEYFDVFPDCPEAGEAVIKDLLNKGELSGAEYFAWTQYRGGSQNQHQTQVPIYGLENPELYRQSYDLYQNLTSFRAAIQRAVEQLRSELVSEQSRMLNSELRDFLRERQRRKTGRFGTDRKGEGDLPAYLDYLGRLANRLLQINLKKPIEQLRFPGLHNFYRLKDTEAQLDDTAAGKEWKEVLKLINANTSTDFERAFAQKLDLYGRTIKQPTDKPGYLPAAGEPMSPARQEEDPLYSRKLLERLWLFSKAHKLDLSPYKQFKRSFRLQILQSEMVVEDLMPEVDLLESFVVERLAKNIDEKQFVKRLENFDLLEKLFSLELTPPEWFKVLRREDEIRKEAGRYRREIQKGVRLEKLVQMALDFYQLTQQRDGVLAGHALKPSREQEKDRPAKVMVMITGGFHGDGIGTRLIRRGIPYAVIHPRFSEFDHGERYAKVMAGDQADLTPYFKVKNPFATKQKAVFFKEIVEVAAPVLIRQYHIDPAEIPGRVAAALSNHPVLSHEIGSEVLGAGHERLLRITPALSGDIQGNIQSATLMPSALSAEPPVYVQMTSSSQADTVFPALTLTWTVQGSVQPSPEPQAVSFVGVDFSASGPLASMLEVTSSGFAAALGLNNPVTAPTAPAAVPGSETENELSPAADQTPPWVFKEVWDFFQPGQGMFAELEKQILMAVPRTTMDMGELGKVVLRFINQVRSNPDFTKRNVMARSALQEFRAAMMDNNKQYLQAFRAAAQPTDKGDRFALLRNFFDLLETAEFSELDVLTSASTEAFRRNVNRIFGSLQIQAASFPESLQQAMREIQAAFRVGFSPRDIGAFLPDQGVKVLGYDDAATVSGELAARLWIAAALVRKAAALSQKAEVDDPRLAALLDSLFGSGRQVPVGDQNVLHVLLRAFPAKEMNAVCDAFVPVLAALAKTHISMRLNLMNSPEDVPGIIDAMVARAAERGRVRLRPKQLQGVSAGRWELFPSIVAAVHSGGQHFALGEVDSVGKVAIGPRTNVRARCGYPLGSNPQTIAEHVLTLIQNLLKQQLSDRYFVIRLDTQFPEAFRSIKDALEAYFADASFRASA